MPEAPRPCFSEDYRVQTIKPVWPIGVQPFVLGHGHDFLVGEADCPPGPDNAGVLHGFQLGLYLGKLVGPAFGYRSAS